MRFLKSVVLGALALGALASTADAQSRHRHHYRGGGQTIIQQAPSSGIDLNTLMLLGAAGGTGLTGGGITGLLPLLALTQPQATTSTIIEEPRRRFRRR